MSQPKDEVSSEAPKGTLQVNKDYLKGCKGKSFLFSKAVSAEMGQGFKSLALISEVKRKLQTEGAKMGAGTSERYLTNNGFKNNTKFGFDSIISNETLDLHDPGLEDWTKCYQTYAAATKYGVLILAKTPANFQVWAQSKACLNEVKGIPDGRLFVYIEHTEDDEDGAQGYICCVRSDASKASATVANGRGYLLFANGNYYHGDLKYGHPHGNGMHRNVDGDVYVGAWEDGNKNGKGKETFGDGNIYDGNWKDGKQDGKGEYKWVNGDVYDGYYKDGNMYGKGEFTWANGNVYYGDWEDDKMHGKGEFKFACGDVYDGNWKDGKQGGKGKNVWSDGDVYDGYYKDGKKHGKGEFTWASGAVYYGDWEDNNMHGKGKYVWASGNVRHDGEWKDDEPHGK